MVTVVAGDPVMVVLLIGVMDPTRLGVEYGTCLKDATGGLSGLVYPPPPPPPPPHADNKKTVDTAMAIAVRLNTICFFIATIYNS